MTAAEIETWLRGALLQIAQVAGELEGVRNDLLILNGKAHWFESDVFPWRRCDFGLYAISGADVTINGGQLVVGSTLATCSRTTLTVATAEAWLGWEYDYASGALTVKDFGSTFSLDTEHIRRWLYHATLDGATGRVTIDRYGVFNGLAPGNFAAV